MEKKRRHDQPSTRTIKRGDTPQEKTDGKALHKPGELRPVSSGIKKSNSPINVAGKAKKKQA